jgi:hypothetical protein
MINFSSDYHITCDLHEQWMQRKDKSVIKICHRQQRSKEIKWYKGAQINHTKVKSALVQFIVRTQWIQCAMTEQMMAASSGQVCPRRPTSPSYRWTNQSRWLWLLCWLSLCYKKFPVQTERTNRQRRWLWFGLGPAIVHFFVQSETLFSHPSPPTLLMCVMVLHHQNIFAQIPMCHVFRQFL